MSAANGLKLHIADSAKWQSITKADDATEALDFIFIDDDEGATRPRCVISSPRGQQHPSKYKASSYFNGVLEFHAEWVPTGADKQTKMENFANDIDTLCNEIMQASFDQLATRDCLIVRLCECVARQYVHPDAEAGEDCYAIAKCQASYGMLF